MRGYGVLFVCALCVFVLCGAAVAVVAQDLTPEEKAAEAARAKARTAKEKGRSALNDNPEFARDLIIAAFKLAKVIDKMGTLKRTADTLSLTGQVPSKEDIKKDIVKLERAATDAKKVLLALEVGSFDSLSDQERKEQLTYKMNEVEFYVMEVEIAAAFVNDYIPTTIVGVIEKADALVKAAEEASALWNAAEGKLEEQLIEVKVAVRIVNTIKDEIESAKTKFAHNESPETPNLNNELTDISTLIVKSPLKTLHNLKTILHNANNAAGEARNEYTALAQRAKELKGKAEERKQKIRRLYFEQEFQNYPEHQQREIQRI